LQHTQNTRINLNNDFRLRAVQHAADAAWIPSALPGVTRRMLDRVGDEAARATPPRRN
jgi:hypothetical protein